MVDLLFISAATRSENVTSKNDLKIRAMANYSNAILADTFFFRILVPKTLKHESNFNRQKKKNGNSLKCP